MSALIYWKFLLNISWEMSAQLQVSLHWPGCFWFLRNTNLFYIDRTKNISLRKYYVKMNQGSDPLSFLIWILSEWWSHGDVTCITTITIHVLLPFQNGSERDWRSVNYWVVGLFSCELTFQKQQKRRLMLLKLKGTLFWVINLPQAMGKYFLLNFKKCMYFRALQFSKSRYNGIDLVGKPRWNNKLDQR